MITHYGLFWSEQDVLWTGKKGSPGCLLGRERISLARRGAPSKAERKTVKDYARFVGIYCLYGEGDLIYVGETGLDTDRTLFQRLKSHRTGALAGWWDSFSWFGREGCAGKTDLKLALQQLEAIAIAINNPGFNKQSGTFGGATQVFQFPHDDAAGDTDTRLARMQVKLDRILQTLEKK